MKHHDNIPVSTIAERLADEAAAWLADLDLDTEVTELDADEPLCDCGNPVCAEGYEQTSELCGPNVTSGAVVLGTAERDGVDYVALGTVQSDSTEPTVVILDPSEALALAQALAHAVSHLITGGEK